MYAVKANRVYKITEEEKQKYIDRGFKIAKLEKDKLVFEEVETEGTKEIAKLEAENKKLKAEVDKLKKELEKEEKEPAKGKKGEGK